jgi:hypothetical protein
MADALTALGISFPVQTHSDTASISTDITETVDYRPFSSSSGSEWQIQGGSRYDGSVYSRQHPTTWVKRVKHKDKSLLTAEYFDVDMGYDGAADGGTGSSMRGRGRGSVRGRGRGEQSGSYGASRSYNAFFTGCDKTEAQAKFASFHDQRESMEDEYPILHTRGRGGGRERARGGGRGRGDGGGRGSWRGLGNRSHESTVATATATVPTTTTTISSTLPATYHLHASSLPYTTLPTLSHEKIPYSLPAYFNNNQFRILHPAEVAQQVEFSKYEKHHQRLMKDFYIDRGRMTSC